MRMNVYLTTGKKNYKYAYVAIESLFEENKSSEIYLYIVSEDLEEKDLAYEIELAERYGNHIILLHFDEEMASKYIQTQKGSHWPIGTMSSYWLFHELLPEEVDRILVIESDTVVVGDLSDIYQMDFEGNYVISSGPEHKPQNHRDFMKKCGGDCLTFVLSVYDVPRIRKNFTLQEILAADGKIKELTGNSMMELAFGLLFAGKIKFIPGKTACIDENERYIEELGYDYLIEAEKTAKIIHFSSYSDYSKPWNPVFLVPGYRVWWSYAVNSPYFKEYIERQWTYYNNTRKKQAEVARNITYRNVLLCTLVLIVVVLIVLIVLFDYCWENILVIIGIVGGSIVASILLRFIGIVFIQRYRKKK